MRKFLLLVINLAKVKTNSSNDWLFNFHRFRYLLGVNMLCFNLEWNRCTMFAPPPAINPSTRSCYSIFMRFFTGLLIAVGVGGGFRKCYTGLQQNPEILQLRYIYIGRYIPSLDLVSKEWFPLCLWWPLYASSGILIKSLTNSAFLRDVAELTQLCFNFKFKRNPKITRCTVVVIYGTGSSNFGS